MLSKNYTGTLRYSQILAIHTRTRARTHTHTHTHTHTRAHTHTPTHAHAQKWFMMLRAACLMTPR